MSYIWFIGDAHLWHNTPSSRKDDYPESILRKLESLLLQIEPNDICIFSGDFFHTPHVADWYLSKVADVLNSAKDRGLKVYTIYGNHEPKPTARYSGTDNSLSVLISSGVIKHLDHVRWNGIDIIGWDYHDLEIEPYSGDSPAIYVIHRFVFEKPDSRISSDEILYYDQIKELNVVAVLAGHDHCIYQPERVGNTLIVRPGALSRGTIHHYNRVREIFISKISISKKKISAEYVKVDCKSPDEIFQEADVILDMTMNRVNEFIEILKRNKKATHSSISEVVNSIDMEPPVKKCIYKYLQEGGVQLI